MMQMLLIFSVVWLGTMMMCNRPQGPTDTRSSLQIFGDPSNPLSGAPPTPKPGEQWDMTKATMCWADATLNWSTLTQIKGLYENAVKRELTEAEKNVKDPAEKKRLEDESQAKLLQGDILAADAQYKYSLTRNSTALMRAAFNSIQSWERSLQGTALWSREFPVPQTEKAPWRFPQTVLEKRANDADVVAADKMTPETLPAALWVADVPGFYRFPAGLQPTPAAYDQLATMAGHTPDQVSGKLVYDRLVADISSRNQRETVYGFIPGYKLIDFLVNATGANPAFSYAFAALLLALIVRAAIFPVAQKQLIWSRKMQQLAPLVKELREQYTDKKTKQVTNPLELNQKTMALYAEYGMNPYSGCLPAVIQFPLFITVYQCMLQYQFAFHRGTFLWVNPATSAATHGWFAPDLGARDYTLIILYGITMVFSTLLMPVSDPSQIKQQRLMGIGMGLLFTFMMFTGTFPTPAAFVLYWVFTNLLATGQSLRAYKMPLPPLEKVNTKTGGVFPMPPFPDPKANGKANGSSNGTISLPKSTGTPAKHKPKKRK